MEVTREVLAEVGADDAPRFLVLNKIDRVDEARRAELAAAHPDALLLSAKRPEDVADLRARLVAYFERDMIEAEVVVPYARQRLVGEIHAQCRVLAETYDEQGTRVRLRTDPATLARLRSSL
jgi:GTP-binding protein HflX